MNENNIKSGRELLNEYLIEQFGDKNLIQVFDKLTELYNEVNSVINISSIKNEDDIYVKHYLDSIYPYKYFTGNCCDVGCGGGFPVIPLAIVTKLNFIGLDSVGKKLTLIKRFTFETPYKNIQPVHARAEELAKTGQKFDTVCARAVSNSDTALTYCAPLIKEKGKVILYKTQNDTPASEKTRAKYNVKLVNTQDYTLPGTDINRRIFIYERFSC